jgi:hypothetical protein
MTLWRYREVITFREFKRSFCINTTYEREYPVIAAVLKYEKYLHLIKYAADILAWHQILFKAIKPGTISREDASAIRNQDIVNMLPKEDQPAALNLLTRFCVAFNATITLSGNLRECSENIFINKTTGEVDLISQSSRDTNVDERKMSPNTPIAFSLPNSLKDKNEFVDPRSLCTLFILDRLKVNYALFI